MLHISVPSSQTVISQDEFLLAPTYENCYTISSSEKQWKEKNKCGTLKNVVHGILGSTEDPLYKTIIQRMLAAYEAQGCRISLKFHFLHFHTNHFPQNLGAYNEERGERYHQDVNNIKRLHQGRWDVNMLLLDIQVGH